MAPKEGAAPKKKGAPSQRGSKPKSHRASESKPKLVKKVVKRGTKKASQAAASESPPRLIGTIHKYEINKESPDIVFGVAMNSNPKTGVVITGLTPGGLIEKCGVCVGDVVVSVNGHNVLYAIETTEMLKNAPVGR